MQIELEHVDDLDNGAQVFIIKGTNKFITLNEDQVTMIDMMQGDDDNPILDMKHILWFSQRAADLIREGLLPYASDFPGRVSSPFDGGLQGPIPVQGPAPKASPGAGKRLQTASFGPTSAHLAEAPQPRIETVEIKLESQKYTEEELKALGIHVGGEARNDLPFESTTTPESTET